MTTADLPFPIRYVGRNVKWGMAWCIRHILQMLFFLPVRKNRVLLSAHNGLEYYCNPKYISEYLVVHGGKDLEIIWGFNHPENYRQIPGIKAVRFNSLTWIYYTATSSVLITNFFWPQTQPKRKGQLFISTWHGGGAYKRVGGGALYVQSDLERRGRHEKIQKVDLFLSSSRAFTEYAIRQDYRYRGEVLPCGMPRNDLFFHQEKREAAARRVRDKLGITGYIAVYAPTFRGKDWRGGYRVCAPFPYQAVLSSLRQRFGEPAVILKRAHPGGDMADSTEENVLDVTAYPDMQELLCAADMLITDYSSSMWDFALLGRPCLLYVPDLEEYATQRGLCTPPEEWPGFVCRNEKELLAAISSLDEQACAEKAARHLQALGSYETGTATEQVCERILRHMGRKDNLTDETDRQLQAD